MLSLWLAMLAAPALPAVADAPAGICARLAPRIGMRATAGPGGRTIWELQTLNRVKALLIGGTSLIAIGVGPTDDPVEATVADYKRLKGACQTIAKGADCSINGPAELRIRIKTAETVLVAAAGEAARVEVFGSRLRCAEGDAVIDPQ